MQERVRKGAKWIDRCSLRDCGISGNPVDDEFTDPYNRFLYTGKEFDFETGLTHMDARSYDPTVGRWLQRDPMNLATLQLPPQAQGIVTVLGRTAGDFLLDVKTQNGYAYVANNPFRYRDSTGLDIELAIDVLLKSKRISETIKMFLNPGLIRGIYREEEKRLTILERLGIDGEKVGRGQIGGDAYQDVNDMLGEEFKIYSDLINEKRKVSGENPIVITKNHKEDLKDADVEDFATAAYLVLRTRVSQRPDRTPEDALKFGIGKYHGGFDMLVEAQNKTDQEANFSPIEEVLKSGTSAQKDFLNYINEIFFSGENYQNNRSVKFGSMCPL